MIFCFLAQIEFKQSAVESLCCHQIRNGNGIDQ